ncbi:MAG: DUF5050 domain-containing protein [Spirochaetes bacterium]|nr:DUF5050 domain-containing protein [Spirochaetota bacterium]
MKKLIQKKTLQLFLAGMFLLLMIINCSQPVTAKREQKSKLVFTEINTTSRIKSIYDDGSLETCLVSGLLFPMDVAIDEENQHLYWIENMNGLIQRSNLDGSDIINVTIGSSSSIGLVVDPTTEKIYWSNNHSTHTIRSCNYDGTGYASIASSTDTIVYFSLDRENQLIYWADSSTLYSVNTDGTNLQVIVAGLSGNYSTALDTKNDKIYLLDIGAGDIQRMNLDGTNSETLVTGQVSVYKLVLDPENNQMFWSDYDEKNIVRANLDGSDIKVIYTAEGSGTPIGLTVLQ